jgi:hypothetical protein
MTVRNQRPPTVLCSSADEVHSPTGRDITAGGNLVGSDPTAGSDPATRFANLVEQIRRKALRMVTLAPLGSGRAVRIPDSAHGHHLREIRDWLLATMAQGRIVFHDWRLYHACP